MGLLDALGLKPLRKPATTSPSNSSGPELTDAAAAADAAAGRREASPGAPAAVDKNRLAYNTARAALQKLVDALQAHPQATHIAAQIAQAQTQLGQADTAANAKDYKSATKHLVDVRASCASAKTVADGWVAYLRLYAEMKSLGMSFDDINDPDMAVQLQPLLDAADVMAQRSPPDFVGATKKLREIETALVPGFKKLIGGQKAKLQTMEAMGKAVREFSKKDIDQAKTHIAEAERALAARAWSVCRQNAFAAADLVGPGVRMGERRGQFDQHRVTTVAEVQKVRANTAVQRYAEALDKLVAQADAFAAYEVRKFEQGIAKLAECTRLALMWTGLATTLAQHAKERSAADADLSALDKHAAAARVAKEREAARLALAQAVQLAKAAEAADTAADPVASWATAMTALSRVRADLAVARRLADSLGVAGAASDAAAQPNNQAGLKKALDSLRIDGKAAAARPDAKLAADAFKRFDAHLAAATKALADDDGATAATALKSASQALVDAKTIQQHHAQFAVDIGGLDAALKALQKWPQAAKIKARIDPVSNGLADARAKDAANDAAGAIMALRQAKDAVAVAKKAIEDSAAFDTHAAELVKRVGTVANAAEKTALQALLSAAQAKADALDFADAKKLHKEIDLRLDKGVLEAVMKAKPDDPKIAKMAAKMVANGGAKTIDDLIQAIPDGGDMQLLNALAEGRYGVKFKSGKPLPALPPTPPEFPTGRPAGDPAKAMKSVCKMFSEIPQDIVKNKSITSVSYEDAFGSAGGAYAPDDGSVSMNGRAGVIKQRFGANLKNKGQQQLPSNVDDACKPVDASKEVEYLGFAAAHEVGHGMDDSSGFMAQYGSQAKYGGWITYGSSVQPIADAIGGDSRFKDFYQTPEQRRYILGRLQNVAVTPPTVTDPSPEKAALDEFEKWFKLATAANVFRRQDDCNTIKIGDRIYHEAYARMWVSYLAVARRQALTGYQFRAPGEWFAELYAGFRSKQLKDEHPAMAWLKKL
jgi:hypothetical protein